MNHKMEGFWGILYVPASLGHIAADISTCMRVILHVMVLYSQCDIHVHIFLGEQRQAQTCRWKWWQVKASKKSVEVSDRMTSCCDYKRERERVKERECVFVKGVDVFSFLDVFSSSCSLDLRLMCSSTDCDRSGFMFCGLNLNSSWWLLQIFTKIRFNLLSNVNQLPLYTHIPQPPLKDNHTQNVIMIW